MVHLHDVALGYGSVTLVTDVNVAVAPGETVALFGRSGSGKTTLLNLVAGLQRPVAGRVEVLGQDMARLSPGACAELRRTRFGLVLQSYGLLPQLSARENITFALRLAGHARRTWKERTDQALEAVGLKGRANHPPAALSGGERQRIAIARALAVQPQILLADEPTGALDHITGQAILSLLTNYARDHGAVVLIATHDASVREQVSRNYRIQAGRLSPVEEATA